MYSVVRYQSLIFNKYFGAEPAARLAAWREVLRLTRDDNCFTSVFRWLYR